MRWISNIFHVGKSTADPPQEVVHRLSLSPGRGPAAWHQAEGAARAAELERQLQAARLQLAGHEEEAAVLALGHQQEVERLEAEAAALQNKREPRRATARFGVRVFFALSSCPTPP